MNTAATTVNPNANMKMSFSALRRMRSPQREGLVHGYYNDGHENSGHCTYGIGILAHRGPGTAEELARPVTATQIEAAFNAAIREAERAVRQHVTRQALTQAQFDALVSYAYNIGVRGANIVFKHIDSGDFKGAVAIMMNNTYSIRNGHPIYMQGLVLRRQEESAPFRQSR